MSMGGGLISLAVAIVAGGKVYFIVCFLNSERVAEFIPDLSGCQEVDSQFPQGIVEDIGLSGCSSNVIPGVF